MFGYVFVEGFCDWQKLNFLVIELRFARFLFSEFGRFDRVLDELFLEVFTKKPATTTDVEIDLSQFTVL